MKIAVTSTDGNSVDTHFGKAESFFIYALDDTSHAKILIEKRDVPKYCSEGVAPEEHTFDTSSASKIDTIMHVLKDCEALFTKKIGEKPKTILVENSIQVIEFDGLVEEI